MLYLKKYVVLNNNNKRFSLLLYDEISEYLESIKNNEKKLTN